MEAVTPRVSIIIPVYNGSDYLQEAIESAINQTYLNKEVIVIDDGSNDQGKTQAIISNYGTKIRAYRKENGGVASALNLGIRMMEGTYFSWLSHDDMYLPDKVSNQINYLRQIGNGDAILYSGYQIVNKEGVVIGCFDPAKEENVGEQTEGLLPVLRLVVNGCTVLIPKKYFDQVGLFNEGLPTTQDYDMWYRLFRGKQVYYSAAMDVLSRSHEAQGSRQNIQAHIKECDTLWIKMITGLTQEEMCALDGSPYGFLSHTYTLLKAKTLYEGAMRYLEKRMYVEQGRAVAIQGRHTGEGCQQSSEIEGLMKLKQVPKEKPRLAYYKMQKQGTGGLEKMTAQMIAGLKDTYEIFVAIGSEEIPGHYVYEEGVHYIGMNPCILFEQLADLFVALRIDVFIGCHNYLDYFLDFYRCLQQKHIPCIAWNHEDYFFANHEETYQALFQSRKLLYPELAKVVWINQRSKRAYEVDGHNGRYIPNSVEQREVGVIEGIQEPFSFVSVGRFEDSIKQLDKLLEVFALIYQECPMAKLWIVGNGNLETPIKALGYELAGVRMQALGIPVDRINFTGWVYDVEAYYRKVKVQLGTSKSEGFGLVIPEAGRYGVPTVSFKNGGAEDSIVDGISGYLVEPGDTVAMARKALQLVKDEVLYRRMAKESRMLQYQFTSYGVLEAWKSLIQEVILANGRK